MLAAGFNLAFLFLGNDQPEYNVHQRPRNAPRDHEQQERNAKPEWVDAKKGAQSACHTGQHTILSS